MEDKAPSIFSACVPGAPRHKLNRRFRSRMDVELLVNPFQVRPNRRDGNPEFIRDLFVKITRTEQLQDFVFAGRKTIHFGGGRTDLIEMLNYLTRYLHGHRRAT